MTELTHRRPQSVADAQEVDYAKALNYLNLSPGQPAAQALILVCQRYQLDPLLGHISLYDGKPYVHFSGYLHIANAHPEFEGIECVREWETDTHFLATVRVHRNDRSYPAERTGRSLKVKPKKGGGSYVDEHADAKAFAQAARRALRMAFNVDHPDPVDDHGGEQPAPEPVVEVARRVNGRHMSERLQEYQPSGAGEREPAPRDRRHDPAPDPTSEEGEGHGGAGSSKGGRFKSGTPATPSPDSTSDPWGLSPLAPRADPSSPPLSADTGKGSGGGDINPSDSEPEAGEAIPSDDLGEGSDGSGGQPASAVAKPVSDGSVTTDPTPPPDPNPVQASLTQQWCTENKQDMRNMRIVLRRGHPDEFKDLKDWRDLNELEGERAALAVKRLDEWLANAKAHEGDK